MFDNPTPQDAAAALARLLQSPKYELIPLKKVMDAVADLPAGATVSVTASPNKGLDVTIDLAERLKSQGFDAVPHLSARLTRDEAHLREVLKRLDAAGITKAFVIGGDAQDPGEFFDALSLLEAMTEIGHSLTEIGIGSYPEGHAVIPDHKLLQALHDKQQYAAYMTTQMCFDPEAIMSWVAAMRSGGITLPVVVGLAGVAPVLKLAQISARIGIGQSMRFLTKQHGLLGKLVRPGGYAPDELILGLAGAVADPVADIQGFHIYTFNQVGTTEAWRLEFLMELLAAG